MKECTQLSCTPARIAAVLVTYRPEPNRLGLVLAAAAKQVDHIVVVDNARGEGLEAVNWTSQVEHIDLGSNLGIAAAQNAGIRRAFFQGATHVLVLDHDSIVGEHMTERLLKVWEERTASGVRVAALGANYRDPRRPDTSPFIQIKSWRLRRVPNVGVVDVSYVISSGCLISREAFDAIGPMNESLFIDYVDIEWGLRAQMLGWKSFGVGNAVLDHTLGDAPLWIFGSGYPLHSPLRHYYMVRNAVWLLMRTALPTQWKVVESWHLVRRVLAYAVFAPKPHLHIAAMFKGLRDGLMGRMGRAGHSDKLAAP